MTGAWRVIFAPIKSRSFEIFLNTPGEIEKARVSTKIRNGHIAIVRTERQFYRTSPILPNG